MLGAEIVIIQETDSIITVTTNRIYNLGIFADNAGSARSHLFRGEGGSTGWLGSSIWVDVVTTFLYK